MNPSRIIIAGFTVKSNIVEAIFATDDRDLANAVIDEYSKYWDSIIGTRGNTGKRIVNAQTKFTDLFEEV